MTRKEKIDWLYRLRSEIAMYIPKRWLIPMYTALDTAIDELLQEIVSKEAYEHEYFLRKELELKVTKLEEQIAKQKHLIDAFRSEMERQFFGICTNKQSNAKNELAQERYQDLYDYFMTKNFGNKKCAERIRYQQKRADNCERELELWERFEPNAFKWFRKYLILLNKVIQAREKIENKFNFWNEPSNCNVESIRTAKEQVYKRCFRILDELIEEEKK